MDNVNINSEYKLDGPTEGLLQLDEFQITWDYDGDGKILLSLNNSEGRMIQSIEHVKSKV